MGGNFLEADVSSEQFAPPLFSSIPCLTAAVCPLENPFPALRRNVGIGKVV